MDVAGDILHTNCFWNAHTFWRRGWCRLDGIAIALDAEESGSNPRETFPKKHFEYISATLFQVCIQHDEPE